MVVLVCGGAFPFRAFPNSTISRDLSAVSPNWFKYITSIPPSADLVPHIQLVNPDFVLHYGDHNYRQGVEKFLVWLKVCLSPAFFFSS